MVDTIRTQSDMLTNLFQDGQAGGSITPNDLRDLVVSTFGNYVDTKATNFTSSDTTDAGVTHEFTAATAVNWTIPPNSSVAYPIGTVIQAFQYGAGQITLVPGAGVTIRTPSTLTSRAQYSLIGVRKRATNEWAAFGDLSTSNSVWTPVTGSYALIFDEEFNGSSLTANRWNSLEGNTLNNVVVHRTNIAVSNSCARVTLAGPYTSMTGACFTTNGSTDNFTFNASNGAVYMEGRCKMPTTPAQGAWPALWTNFAGNFPEFDLLEWAGSRPMEADLTFHKVNDGAAPPTGTNGWGMGAIPNLGVDLSLAFHIYGLLWTPTDATFYVDGVQQFTLHNGDSVTGTSEGGRWGGTAVPVVFPTSGESQCIIVQIGANGLGSNTADAGTTFPSTMACDYIHVYQVGGTPVTPQTNYGGPGSTLGPTS